MIAVYDSAGREIGAEDRAVVYRDGLWHASAGVLVRSGDGRSIYVHRRTDTKMVFAGMHDCLAGGVVDPGESPRQTATRELAEELGITAAAELTPLARASWDGEWSGSPMRCHLFAYELRYDGPIRHQPEEIAEGWWWPEQTLREHLAAADWPFVPDTRYLLATSNW
ncbi:NUDIX hydrolase [Nocardia cyriacigeorgica]|uniref:NUDIX hydrolase n=1 Tax=Nocardia cyriacigeorgica TaxID=135487 RepID=UPI00055F20B5|nr:NUDIX domain-containing protein [Nocardia cyriacigeorgica]MBF6162668.1 NUDIX domain-containing protein [Nocardia cyriacigeorgica]MBF6198126.1 NUDIX domain-containing protein [Nocardia cyriacigeorgica]MBF6316990.1 NUDIX domain-containing protein [Nocardia cyriacigeorgica]MBF6347121.1 NUDIX domain-containing protein [Nocardia cyriacigeorgica]MBF6513967.1 NUDIX domain-containing protein [Nocardia cyriacigeorgica]